MKAIVQHGYGSPETTLTLEDVARPEPSQDEVLVRVRASSVNAADLDLLRGIFVIRIGAPIRPKYRIPGTDVAGQVEAVGDNVTTFRPGDEVYGDLSEGGHGAFAEYVCAAEHELTIKPPAMSFEDAATLPQAGVIAVQGLRDTRQVGPGDQVLINGAGGGMGTFAVQIASALGAEVTGVDSPAKSELVRSIGAQHFIDHTREDFTEGRERYDLILDMVGNQPLSDCVSVLSDTGALVLVGGPVIRFMRSLFLSQRMTGDQSVAIQHWRPNDAEDVATLAHLADAGSLTPVIDSSYPLIAVPEALLRLEQGQVIGKAVITL